MYSMTKGVMYLITMVAVFSLFGEPAAAKRIDGNSPAVSRIVFENRGAYSTDFYVIYRLDNGRRCKLALKGKFEDKTSRYNLTRTNFIISSGPNACAQAIPEGAEVWGFYSIDDGDDKGCRKDGTSFRYHPNGGTLVYRSRGTLYNNNNCHIRDRPGVTFDEAETSDLIQE